MIDLRRWLIAAVATSVSLSLSGCDRSGDDTLDVYAASSLTESFADLEVAYEAAHPGTDVRLHLAGSQTLRLQVEQGARADVFASANVAHVDALVSAGLASSPTVFAANELVVAVPKDAAADWTFDDLPDAERIVIGTPDVPIGAYARQVLSNRGDEFRRQVMERVVSEEANVRLVRAKVELGEVDAAIVYRTDVHGRSGLAAVDIPDTYDVRAEYFAAATSDDQDARRFIEFLTSDAASTILASHGFGASAKR